MIIYLVRHGETEWNLEGRIQGNTNVSLSERGKEQARRCAEFFSKKIYHRASTSGLQRAIQTAEIIVDGKVPISQYQEFNERSFGSWQTRLWSEVRRDTPKFRERWEEEGRYFRPPNGECVDSMIKRVTKGFQEVVDQSNSNLLLVAHGGPIKVIIGYAMGVDEFKTYEALKMYNCGISTLIYEQKKFRVDMLNHVH
ncbi:histidine phosphatase family protein [Candidatus Woesearchaeota archaeon]|nr:histidine phosphatase family protein [Candidatus Woesearchaeota archaeon]